MKLMNMFEFFRNKKIEETETKLDKLTQLNNEIQIKRNELRALVNKAFPLGGVVGIYAKKENPSYIVVGYLFVEGKRAMLQIAKINPRARNAMSISIIDTTDAKYHGFAHNLDIEIPPYEKD